ncbi:DUF3895 domain-containing protein [Priestia megaterium]
MAIYPKNTQVQRNLILRNLSEEQQEFIENKLERSRKDLFDTLLVKDKGEHSVNIDDPEEWEFLQYNYDEDRKLKCECGRSLNHQYVVSNKRTGVVRKFGITHFETHTGIPTQIVKDIVKGIGNIDYNLDELLYKVKYGWDSEVINRAKELMIRIPDEINGFINVQLPLLDKYIDVLIDLILQEENRLERERRIKEAEERKRQIKKLQEESDARTKAAATPKIKIEISPYEPSNPYALDESLKKPVYQKLNELRTASTRTLCQELNIYDHTHQGEYLTGKPKIYPYVVNYLEELVSKGRCKFISGDLKDRVYTIDF